MPPVPLRVSRTRVGVRLMNMPVVPATEASVNQPTTSTMTWVSPPALYRVILPSVPTFTIARLDTVSPATQFRLAASGRGSPFG